MTGCAAAVSRVTMPGETSHTEISAISQRNQLKLEEQEGLANLLRTVLGFVVGGQRFYTRFS